MTVPTSSTPGIYRLVSTALASGVAMSASNNDNITFVTNIPSLDYAIRIWRTRLTHSFTVIPVAPAAGATIQLFGQLTENQTKTSVLVNDTSYLDQWFMQPCISNTQASAVGEQAAPLFMQEVIHDFNPVTTPWTVATKLNWVTSTVSVSANFTSGTWKPLVTIEYTLERLTADLRDYLAKRLQIQGS